MPNLVFIHLLKKQYQRHTFALTHVDCHGMAQVPWLKKSANNHLKVLFHLRLFDVELHINSSFQKKLLSVKEPYIPVNKRLVGMADL